MGLPGTVTFGITTIEWASGETPLVIKSAFLSISSSCYTHVTCFKGRVYGCCEIGGLSPVPMSLRVNVVLLISEKSDKITS